MSDADLAFQLLAAASRLVDGIQDGMRRRGFEDVRPAHGFAFVRISSGEATVIDVAAHLGVTKQAASQLVDQLVQRGYVTRSADPDDARRRVLALTERGHDCTRAAEDSAADVVQDWRAQLGASATSALHHQLRRLDLGGPLRPAW